MALSAVGSPLTASSVCSVPPLPSATLFRVLSIRNSRLVFFSASSSCHRSTLRAISDQDVLDAIAKLDSSENALPAVRVFENDLARLTLVGAVDFQQALTAAAADGGEAADDHLSSGMDAMVVETVFPGSSDDQSTVSTRLFLPARKVKEKATKLKKSLTKDILHGTTPKNILAMTFRQVVLQKLWSLELAIFSPRAERNMDILEQPREVPIALVLATSDERMLSVIGEVVCNSALEATKKNVGRDSMTRKLNRLLFGWLKKNKGISSQDSSACLHNLLENEVLASASTLLEKFHLERVKFRFEGTKVKNLWWSSLAFSELERIGGPEFCAWIGDSLPSYMLEIEDKKFRDLKLDGWKKSGPTKWEALLVHSQIVGLADILDMYYEDAFTLPEKKLSCREAVKSSSMSSRKGNSLFNAVSSVIVAVIFLVSISVLKKVYLPHLPMKINYIQSKSDSSDESSIPLCSIDSRQLEEYCVRIISRVKNSFAWPGEVRSDPEGCAWIGELPKFLRMMDDTASLDSPSASRPLEAASEEERKALENIAMYQVVLSSDGIVVGFQPTSRIAVNNWAGHPLAKDLYGGKDLSPGFVEPGLKVPRPNSVVVLELLMSLNPNSRFALVRPLAAP